MTRQYVHLFYKNWRLNKPEDVFANELFEDMLKNQELISVREQWKNMDSIIDYICNHEICSEYAANVGNHLTKFYLDWENNNYKALPFHRKLLGFFGL